MEGSLLLCDQRAYSAIAAQFLDQAVVIYQISLILLNRATMTDQSQKWCQTQLNNGLQLFTRVLQQQQTHSMMRTQSCTFFSCPLGTLCLPFLFPLSCALRESLTEVCCLLHAESAHQKGATDQVEAMARDLEYTRAELASAKQNLDKAHSDQSKVGLFGEQLNRLCLNSHASQKQQPGSCT